MVGVMTGRMMRLFNEWWCWVVMNSFSFVILHFVGFGIGLGLVGSVFLLHIPMFIR
jgi:hypothetical protein